MRTTLPRLAAAIPGALICFLTAAQSGVIMAQPSPATNPQNSRSFGNHVPGGPMGFGPNGTTTGASLQTNIPTKKVIPYVHVDERDYIWSKRVWRTIDLREKFNYPLYYPLQKMSDRWSLWHILVEGIHTQNLTAYFPVDLDKYLATQGKQGNDGDQFKYPVLPPTNGAMADDYKNKMNTMTSVCVEYDSVAQPIGIDGNGLPKYKPEDIDQFGNPKIYTAQQCDPIGAQDIIEYKVKEDWFFDRQRSVLDVRIIGIAPVTYVTEAGKITGKQEKFWIYFPEARYLLQNFFAYNEHNMARRMSFDDLFWKRKFQSYINKESNVYDRSVNDYKVGVDALLTSEDIKYQIFKFEHDLWHY